MSALIVRLSELASPRMAIAVQRLVRLGQRNRRATEIRKDKRYFQPLGWWDANRVIHQIRLLLDKDELQKL